MKNDTRISFSKRKQARPNGQERKKTKRTYTISIMDEKEGKIFVDRAEKIVQGLTKALARELCTFLQNNLEV